MLIWKTRRLRQTSRSYSGEVPALRQEGNVYRTSFRDAGALRQEGSVYRTRFRDARALRQEGNVDVPRLPLTD